MSYNLIREAKAEAQAGVTNCVTTATDLHV